MDTPKKFVNGPFSESFNTTFMKNKKFSCLFFFFFIKKFIKKFLKPISLEHPLTFPIYKIKDVLVIQFVIFVVSIHLTMFLLSFMYIIKIPQKKKKSTLYQNLATGCYYICSVHK